MQEIQNQVNDDLAAVSAVIVNYNAGSLLVDSVRAALLQAKQVIVVDNASSDSSLKLLQISFANDLGLKTIQAGSNLGFAAACNIGIKHCTEQSILFLNPDCILRAGSLKQMLQTLDANPKAGMVGGLLLNPDGMEQGGGRRSMPTPWRSFVRAFGLSKFSVRWPSLFYDFHLHKQPLPDHPISVEAISGALMLVRREAMEDVGIWDEEYFLHCEDLDWCMRFRKKGWSILFDAKAPAIHIHGACSVSRPVFVEWNKHKGMVRFYRKFFQHQYPGLLMWFVIAGVWMRFAMVASIKAFKRNEAQQLNIAKAELGRVSATGKVFAAVTADISPTQSVRTVAVVGASSMVGSTLVPLLLQSGVHVIAYSRKPRSSHPNTLDGVEWREMTSLTEGSNYTAVQNWIWVAPIKALPQNLAMMQRAGARHIVALSTTSRYTKRSSSSIAEREFVAELVVAEKSLQTWAAENKTSFTVLRPTLIYGLGMDKNVGIIAKFIHRFHFFPTLGKTNGLRQPIHARDVAAACKAALERKESLNQTYNISGAEQLSYREMVVRIFRALELRPHFFPVPLWMFAIVVNVMRVLPPFRSWSTAMAERMNQDMVFDHDEAARDLGFAPQAFCLDKADLPPNCR